MAEWKRRDIFKLGLSSLAFSQISCGARPRRPVSTERPRYHVVVLLSGGIDPIYTTDPKVRAEVESGVDLPYQANEIVDAGDFQLGPHFAPLARWSKRMAILNGVQTTVTNHETGSTQFARLRTKVKYSTPSVLEVIARYRDGQPLGCVSMGPTTFWDYSSGWFGTPEKVIAAGRPGGLKVLSLFQRLVRLRREAHSAKVESASPLSGDVQAQIETELTRMYGPGLSLSYGSNPALLSGVRITVGSDVYDGSVKGRLTALEERF